MCCKWRYFDLNMSQLTAMSLLCLSVRSSVRPAFCPCAPFSVHLCFQLLLFISIQPLHEDWVRKVKFIPNLNSFVSCATTNETSIYIGDLDRKKTNCFFKIRKGIVCFDYDKETNVISKYYRQWKPYNLNFS